MGLFKFVTNAVGDVIDTFTGKSAVKAYGKQIKPVIDYYAQFLPYYKEAVQEWKSWYESPQIMGLGNISNQTTENIMNIVKPWSPSGLLGDLLNRAAIQQSMATKALELQTKQKALGAMSDLASQAAANWASARGARAEANFGMAASMTGLAWDMVGKLLGMKTGGNKSGGNG